MVNVVLWRDRTKEKIMRTTWLLMVMGLVSYSMIQAAGEVEDERAMVCDLNQSTTIILELLRTGELGSIVEEHTAEQLDMIIKNFSPALMAFEAEVLSCTLPVLLYFYRTSDHNKATSDAFIAALASQYKDRTKIVAIDAELFFSLAQAVDVQDTPAFGMCRDRRVDISVTGSDNIGHVTTLVQ